MEKHNRSKSTSKYKEESLVNAFVFIFGEFIYR